MNAGFEGGRTRSPGILLPEPAFQGVRISGNGSVQGPTPSKSARPPGGHMDPRRSAARFIMVCKSGQDHRPLQYVLAGKEPGNPEDGAKAAAARLDRCSECGTHRWRRIEIR